MFKKGDEVVLEEMVAPFTEGIIHSFLGVDLHGRQMYVIEFELNDGKTWEILSAKTKGLKRRNINV